MPQQSTTSILVLGTSNSGKTTLLEQMGIGEIYRYEPIAGLITEFVEYRNVILLSWDPTPESDQSLFVGDCYKSSSALIFVVDSADREQLQTSRKELQRLLGNTWLRKKPLLVLLNKQDLPDTVSRQDLSELLDLDNAAHGPWLVQETSVISHKGLYQGLEWLTRMLERRHSMLTIPQHHADGRQFDWRNTEGISDS